MNFVAKHVLKIFFRIYFKNATLHKIDEKAM